MLVKVAIILLALAFMVSRIGPRWISPEMRRAAQAAFWLLAAYIAVMAAIAVIAVIAP